MSGRRLLDPRWHWLRTAMARLYAELDPDARPLALTVTFTDGTGQVIAYTADGGRLLSRTAITDPEGAADAVDAATVSLDPGDVTG